MLSPDGRSMLTDALTPPPGMKFDAGVATTYSLDPTALLTVPLHLAWLASGADADLLKDPVRLLEALRRVSSRLTVFFERGRMKAPDDAHPLYSLLEGMLHQAVAPHGGSFHPKAWLLRFVPESGEGDPAMRLIIQSRNLTFDNCWDVSLRLEGATREGARRHNAGLERFLRALPSIADRKLSRDRARIVGRLIEDACGTDWDLPEGFEEIRFIPLGLDSSAWRPPESERLAVISPFVGPDALDALANSTEKARILISRQVELDELPTGANEVFSKTFVLKEQAETGFDEQERRSLDEKGLHAKVYIAERSWYTHLILGSANATNRILAPGAVRNVELLVELVGTTSRVGGIDDLLSEKHGLGGVLADYERSPSAVTDEKRQIEKRLDELQDAIASGRHDLKCAAEGADWRLTLVSEAFPELGDTAAIAWLLSSGAEHGVSLADLGRTGSVDLGLFATADVTTLIGFRLVYKGSPREFALAVPAEGLPEDREAAIVRRVVNNRDSFLRYLRLILSELGSEMSGGAPWHRHQGKGSAGVFSDLPIFEMLARSFANDPTSLEPVARLLERLAGDDGVVPDEFRRVWAVFQQAIGGERAKA